MWCKPTKTKICCKRSSAAAEDEDVPPKIPKPQSRKTTIGRERCQRLRYAARAAAAKDKDISRLPQLPQQSKTKTFCESRRRRNRKNTAQEDGDWQRMPMLPKTHLCHEDRSRRGRRSAAKAAAVQDNELRRRPNRPSRRPAAKTMTTESDTSHKGHSRRSATKTVVIALSLQQKKSKDSRNDLSRQGRTSGAKDAAADDEGLPRRTQPLNTKICRENHSSRRSRSGERIAVTDEKSSKRCDPQRRSSASKAEKAEDKICFDCRSR